MVIHMTQKPKAPIHLDDEEVDRLMEAEKERVNQVIRSLPKEPVSFRLSYIHHMALAALCTETGLTRSEIVERLVMAGIVQALEDKGLPAVEDFPAAPFQVTGRDKGAA